MKTLNCKTIIYSFTGIGETSESAENDAARKLLCHTKAYLEFNED